MLIVATRHKISPANGEHRGGLIEVNFPGAAGGYGGVAVENYGAQGETLSTGNEGRRFDRVVKISQETGANVELSAKGKDVDVALHRFEVQMAVIRNSILAEIGAVAEDVESGSNVHPS